MYFLVMLFNYIIPLVNVTKQKYVHLTDIPHFLINYVAIKTHVLYKVYDGA